MYTISLTVAVCLLAFAFAPAAKAVTEPQILTLKLAGQSRLLPKPILGANLSAFYEHLMDNPAKTAVLKTMQIGLDRFPGGSDSNFYNWRTGLFEIKSRPDSSAYVRFWVKAAAHIARGQPKGIRLEEYESFSRQLGAEVVLVANLETSSIAEQVEWFKHLASVGAVPQRIEMGNEFWIAMGNDPESLARWPDVPSTMRTMKQYVEALKPYFPPNAKVAVQAATGAVAIPEKDHAPFWQRLRQWDDNLRPEPWFDAVTLHLHPRLADVVGDPQAGIRAPTPENALPRLKAMLAHGDEGIERIIQNTERRLPGKEIWITEWNAQGANTVTSRGGADEPMSPAMGMLMATRMALVYLRHPSVTAALYFQFVFRANDPFSLFVSDGADAYAPGPIAAVLRWLYRAANTGGSFQRVLPEGAKPVAGGGAKPYSYLPMEGGLFQSNGRTTLILENATDGVFSFDPAKLVSGKRPASIEFISMPDLSKTAKLPAKIEKAASTGTIVIQPFSVTRVVWE